MTFDESTGTSGTPARTIYVGVADKDDTAGHALYIATSDTAGPYDGAKGDVWKYDTQASTWARP
ncbi:hypothetical protein LUW76_14260 [Actinomadura madurae]|uniref:hypothetical protein n=1 Tax=Actinomadura madurae TaxID=1993 RepID=UPI00202604E5|nr:hypothetical protein [Actinomadura madurae]URM95387.1 hypothetical protein LUW76_14260 [Actinomadura madurae]URN06083.1 hypothetical protein LUW74_24075 [Actinomadura madurae]